MNALQRLLLRLGLDGPLERRADELAAECSEVVAARLSGAPEVSSMNEARGYIRARAATTIRRHVAEIQGMPDRRRRQLQDMVGERLAERFATQFVRRPLVQRPVVLQRAA